MVWHKKFAKISRNICEIFAKYSRKICEIFAKNLQKICEIFAKNSQKIREKLKFAKYLRKIREKIWKNSRMLIFREFFTNISRIFHEYFTNISRIFRKYFANISRIFRDRPREESVRYISFWQITTNLDMYTAIRDYRWIPILKYNGNVNIFVDKN